MMPTEGATVIGQSMKIDGELTGEGDLVVDGEVAGTIRLTSSRVTVRADGRVRAAVYAQDVVVLGLVEGEIRATGRVELRDGAIVKGNVFSARLSMEEGATLKGGVDPTKAGEPAAQSDQG